MSYNNELSGRIFPRKASGFRPTTGRGQGPGPINSAPPSALQPAEGRPVLSRQARIALLTNAMDAQPYNHRLRPWTPSNPNFPIQPVYGGPRGGEGPSPWRPDFPIQPVYGGPRGGEPLPWKPDFPIQPVYGGPRGDGPAPWKPDFPIQPVYGAPRGDGPAPWKPDFPIQPVYGSPRQFS